MLHELLRLDRPLIIPDTETTGLPGGNNRIVEIGAQHYTSAGLQKEWKTLLQPGVPIPEEVVRIHHITDAMVAGCRVCGGSPEDTEGPFCTCEEFKPWPTFKQIAGPLAREFSNCYFAGKNVRFDLEMFAEEFDRAEVPWSYKDARIIDADRLEQISVPRTLSHLYKKYTGEDLDGAHGALTDVRATVTVIVAQLRTHTSLPREIQLLHELQWPGRIDSEGKFRLKDGVVLCMFGKYRNQSIQSIPPDYWRFILSKDFKQEIKDIAKNALQGIYPKEKS
jgi:DNA polymerase-3 subunit epsilon